MWGATGWLACLIMGAYSIALDISENLKGVLTSAEWILLMGNTKIIPDYTVIYPRFIANQLLLDAPDFGEKFLINISMTYGLVSSDFLMLETTSNGSKIITNPQDDLFCHFRSETAALSLCDGIRGIAHVDHHSYYIIHPLPKRFHNATSSPHILIRKTQHQRSECVHPGDCYYMQKKRKRKKIQHMNSTPNPVYNDNLSEILSKTRSKREVEGPVFVETAVFVDRDLFEHMTTNFPVDTERELIRFVLAMINAVQLLYHDASLGKQVNFVLKRLEILKEEAAGLTRSPDIDRFLSSFCNWQRTKNPVGDREPQHWDHALILTGLDLYVRNKHGKISSQVVGLAPVAGMCTSTSSCTVNEGRHFESVYVVAHEIGHNLGMRHDGPLADNDCDPSSYIMSSTLGSGKITWSTCSRKYLQQFLDTPQSRCLLDHSSSSGPLDHSAEGALPGERFNADQQCMLKYGRGSRHSSQQPLDDVCRDLHCERERYTWTSHPALEGTMCGQEMWCRGGKCITKGLSPNAAYVMSTSLHDKVDGGWTPWSVFGECASGCLFGEEGRLRAGSTGIMVASRTCTNPRPQGGGSQCEGLSKKYQACNAKQCLNVPRLTVREFADQICGRAKDVDSDLTGTGFQRLSSDSQEACTVWCQKKHGSSKSRGWTFPDGTACQTRRTRLAKPSYCINGVCEEFGCDSYEDSTFLQMSDLCPVDRDDNSIIHNVGLRQRDSRVHWSSASGCHFNCISSGSGIRLVVSSTRGKKTRSSIQLCQLNEESCGRIKTPYQYASMVCGKYKDRVRRLSGFGMQISAALEDPDRPCRVACQDENISHRFYLVNGEDGWFPFGTECAKGLANKKAYCISGKCLDFGTDGTPLSKSEFTLPLLSRIRRSLFKNGTKVTAVLRESDLEEIVRKLNETLLSKVYAGNQIEWKTFSVDLSNPINVNLEERHDAKLGKECPFPRCLLSRT